MMEGDKMRSRFSLISTILFLSAFTLVAIRVLVFENDILAWSSAVLLLAFIFSSIIADYEKGKKNLTDTIHVGIGYAGTIALGLLLVFTVFQNPNNWELLFVIIASSLFGMFITGLCGYSGK